MRGEGGKKEDKLRARERRGRGVGGGHHTQRDRAQKSTQEMPAGYLRPGYKDQTETERERHTHTQKRKKAREREEEKEGERSRKKDPNTK